MRALTLLQLYPNASSHRTNDLFECHEGCSSTFPRMESSDCTLHIYLKESSKEAQVGFHADVALPIAMVHYVMKSMFDAG